ncbi:hypothetical protein HCC09_06020 [Streptococcus suis]|nr:hypothetical protein [Streptococcus suis]
MYSKYEITHVACDRKQDVKTVYNEYKANKQQFINKIANCVKDDVLKTYGSIISVVGKSSMDIMESF